MIGTRGVPAAYGGFETAVEEVSRRLVDRGHEVTVYTRGSAQRQPSHLGIRLVHLPAVPQKQLETLSHTGISTLHAVLGRPPEVAFVFNAANAPFLPLLRVRGIPVALHMDGLEWKRAKWGKRGREYYRWAEEFGVRNADALIADAPGIADYYAHQFGIATELIRYGAPIQEKVPTGELDRLGLVPDGYHLVVARFEPENHVLDIVQGYHSSSASKALVVVGSAPYSAAYKQAIEAIANSDRRIRLLGGVYDQDVLDALYFHAYSYLHGHSVGGTNPSLLRAMGAGTAVIAYDVVFNREVLSDRGWYFREAEGVTAALALTESDEDQVHLLGEQLRVSASRDFSWNDVALAYEDLAHRLAQGQTLRSVGRRPRRVSVDWDA
ncbi:glycosyltransferase [Tessaracoccus antarcticus]|uniref:Glycosyltransferase family 1 protein n=1 Tax=Tessaracoccus antarcticus TaxID=2479848 RepID=A0A3M0GBL9_9ACTN|nr:glycosyltransferase [Tessaracoccus antarcticus]RMB58449.1 glycosyltransferase family 1 protein [Tessaracoccus antarcticus]